MKRIMKLTPKIQKAINKASILHDGQRRKGNNLPYIVHPFSVAFILSIYTDDEDIIAAGLLHDVLEDVKGYYFKDLKKDFGSRISKIVKEISEDKDPNIKEDKKATWQTRKEKYLSHLKNASYEAMMVCCADKIHNLHSLIEAYKEQGDELWKKFNASLDKKLWFYEEILRILKEKLDNEIVKDFEKVYLKAKKLFKK